jgi:hypothetical protein
MSNHPANHVPNPAEGIPQAGTAGRRRVVVVPVLPQQNPLTLFAALVAAVLTLVAHIVIVFLRFNPKRLTLTWIALRRSACRAW